MSVPSLHSAVPLVDGAEDGVGDAAPPNDGDRSRRRESKEIFRFIMFVIEVSVFICIVLIWSEFQFYETSEWLIRFGCFFLSLHFKCKSIV